MKAGRIKAWRQLVFGSSMPLSAFVFVSSLFLTSTKMYAFEASIITTIEPALEFRGEDEKLSLGTPLVVDFSVENQSEEAVRIRRYFSIFDHEFTHVFDVVRDKDGLSIAYRGPYAKRSQQNIADTIVLEPGVPKTVLIDLGQNFHISEPGVYSIKPRGWYVVGDSKVELASEYTDILSPISLNPSAIEVLPNPNSDKMDPPHNNPSQYDTPYANCSEKEKEQLVGERAKAAKNVSILAQLYHRLFIEGENMEESFDLFRHYKNWFGKPEATLVEKVIRSLVEIEKALSSKEVDIICFCSKGLIDVLSYIRPNVDNVIRICDRYWDLENTGYDSTWGVLVYGASYFTQSVKTKSRPFISTILPPWESSSMLADLAPHLAVQTSENYQYAVEGYFK